MKKRNPIAVVLLSFITIGIYALVWVVKTKGEMNSQGATIPTAWLLIVPFVNIYWMWLYCGGVAQVTRGKLGQPVAFILMILLSAIGYAVIQNSFNEVAVA